LKEKRRWVSQCDVIHTTGTRHRNFTCAAQFCRDGRQKLRFSCFDVRIAIRVAIRKLVCDSQFLLWFAIKIVIRNQNCVIQSLLFAMWIAHRNTNCKSQHNCISQHKLRIAI